MQLSDLAEGQWCSRSQWDGSLYVVKKFNFLWYFDRKLRKASMVGEHSGIHDHINFKNRQPQASDRAHCYRQITEQLPKGNHSEECNIKVDSMKYSNTVITVESTNGETMGFDTEELALEHVATRLEASPRSKFNMFNIYQTVNPVKVDLSKLITKVKQK